MTKPLYLQTTEVTQRQWKAIMENNSSLFKGDNRPVEQVSWHDAKEFIRKLNQREGTDGYRLPTEAEWEYACRAGTTTPFYTGECISTDQANYNGKNPESGCSKGVSRGEPMAVGSFSPNVWCLYDMPGNVSEWGEDRYERYSSGPVTDPTGPETGSSHVLRGGSWTHGARGVQSMNRYSRAAFSSGSILGFRVARGF